MFFYRLHCQANPCAVVFFEFFDRLSWVYVNSGGCTLVVLSGSFLAVRPADTKRRICHVGSRPHAE